MQQYSEIIIALITFVSGVGFQWLINIRANSRQVSNKVAVEEFESVQQVVESSINRIGEMTKKYELLQERILELSNDLNKERLLSNSLRKELNSLLNECNCNELDAARIRREYQL